LSAGIAAITPVEKRGSSNESLRCSSLKQEEIEGVL